MSALNQSFHGSRSLNSITAEHGAPYSTIVALLFLSKFPRFPVAIFWTVGMTILRLFFSLLGFRRVGVRPSNTVNILYNPKTDHLHQNLMHRHINPGRTGATPPTRRTPIFRASYQPSWATTHQNKNRQCFQRSFTSCCHSCIYSPASSLPWTSPSESTTL